jgi:hypothetical protein
VYNTRCSLSLSLSIYIYIYIFLSLSLQTPADATTVPSHSLSLIPRSLSLSVSLSLQIPAGQYIIGKVQYSLSTELARSVKPHVWFSFYFFSFSVINFFPSNMQENIEAQT